MNGSDAPQPIVMNCPTDTLSLYEVLQRLAIDNSL
jgi:hypothetical protein